MKRASTTSTASATRRERQGFTLLELIGVLTVIAIMVAVVMPPIIQHLKQAAADQESATLQRLAKGFNAHVLRNKQVPDETSWAEAIATELGVHTDEVSINARRVERVYLIDPALRIGETDGKLPYTQTNDGSQVTPAAGSWRLMIVSSMDAAYPIPVSSGVGETASFDKIWKTADGAVPEEWPTGWLNHGEELKIQRINLAPLFKRLILTSYDSPTSGTFATDDNEPGSIPPEGVNAFFIEGTVVSLYDGTHAVESRQLLRWPATFVFERGSWRGQIFQGLKLTDDDLYPASTLFLKSALNANATSGATPDTVVDAMTGYMTNYANWATAGFPGAGAPAFNAVQAAQTALKNASEGLTAQPAP